MPASSIGLHIGSDSAELVVLSGSFHSPRLVGSERISIPPGPWRSQFQTKETEAGAELSKEAVPIPVTGEEVVAALSTLLKNVSLPSSQIYVAAASESVIIRYFQMPMIPIHERKMAVSYEAKKYLPFKVEDLITDSHVVTHRSDPALMRVMFFGIKKNVSMTYQLLLRTVGLTPLCLEPPPIALMRLMRQSGQSFTAQACAILCIEQSNATISIVKDDLLYLSRNVTSADLMETLLSETRVSIDYYRRRFLGEPAIQKMIVFGLGITKTQVDELSSALELPVEIGEPFKRIGAGKNASAGFAVATGLALRGLEKKPGQPNLLPLEFRRESGNFLKPLLIPSAVAFGFLCIASSASLLDLNTYRQQVTGIQQQQVFPAGLTPGIDLQELLHFRLGKQQQIQFLKELSHFPEKQSELLGEMANLLPPEAWLEQISLIDTLKTESSGSPLEVKHRRAVLFRGGAYANNRDQELQRINDFLSELKKSPRFSSCFTEFNLDSVERNRFYEELEVTEFSLSAAMSRDDLAELSQRSRSGGSRRYQP